MQLLEFSLRGHQIKGTVTNDDAFFFCSYFYNERELKLSREGKEQEAFSAMSARFRERRSDEGGEEAIAADLAFKVRREISHNWETRKIVTWRILECFSGFPEDMIYWHSESSFGIRLDIVELVEIFMRVIGVIMNNLEGENVNTAPDESVVSSEIKALEARLIALKQDTVENTI